MEPCTGVQAQTFLREMSMNGKYRDVLVSENKLISDVLCRQQALRDLQSVC